MPTAAPAYTRTARRPIAWDDPRPTVSIPRACAVVGVSRRTIYNWLRAGRLDWKRTAGGTVRIVTETLWAHPPGAQS